MNQIQELISIYSRDLTYDKFSEEISAIISVRTFKRL